MAIIRGGAGRKRSGWGADSAPGTMEREPADIKAIFARSGVRCTRQRERVYRVLRGTRRHPTAEEVYCALDRGDDGVSLATVYNTLEVLARRGLCRRLRPAGGSGACRFDAHTAEHAHVVMPGGEIVDVPEEVGEEVLRRLGPELIGRVERALGVKVARVQVAFEVQ